jgi:hypothetical protein
LFLNARRSTIHNFEKVTTPDNHSVNRWFASAWLSEIANATGLSAPEVRLVEFIATLGGLIPPSNPHPYGFLNVIASPPLAKPFKPELVLDIESQAEINYYLSEDFTGKTDDPFIELDLGKCPLLIRKAIVDCSLDHELAMRMPNAKVQRIKNRRSPPHVLVFEMEVGGQVTKQELNLKDGRIELDVLSSDRITRARFTMVGESIGGGRILRVRRIELCGSFVAE